MSNDMDDINDATEAIFNAAEALRLAGVETEAVSNALIGRGILLKLMDGALAEDVLEEIEDIMKTGNDVKSIKPTIQE